MISSIAHTLSIFLFDLRRATVERKGELELGFGPTRACLIKEFAGLYS